MEVAFFDRTARGRLIVTGRDRVDLVDRLATNRVIGVEEGRRVLMRMATDSRSGFRASAAWCLAAVGASRWVAEKLRHLLQDPDDRVRAMAGRAFESLYFAA